MDSVKFKIDEENQIRFKLHVQGTTSEPGATEPEFRFVLSSRNISEAGNSIGYVFPAKKEHDGIVSVTIPVMEGTLIKENKEYIGKMEILIGSRYFTPSTMTIVFEKEFKITAEAIVDNKSKSVLSETQSTTTSSLPEPLGIKTEAISFGKPEIKQPTQQQHKKPSTANNTSSSTGQSKIQLNLTMEDIKNSMGDDKKLKRIIAEKLAKQLSPKAEKFIPLVEKTFANVKSQLIKNENKKSSTVSKMNVEEIFDLISEQEQK